MNSTITIDDTDEEVIDLDSSQDATVTDNDQSECSIKNHSLSNNDANNTDIISANDECNKSRFESEISNSSCTTLKPFFRVMFRDESVSRQYSKRIKEFLEELVSSKIKSQENDNGLTLEVWDNDNDSTSQSIEIAVESEGGQNIVCDTLFTVDTQPKVTDDFDVPTYGKKYENVFDKLESDTKPKSDYVPKVTCFNCMENHTLRDCPNPRNYAAIEQNRKNFTPKGNSKSQRYHLENEQRFGHIIPGQLSSNLRKALGIKSHELPRHIYRMRTLGYPPGWLEEAHIQHSGLTLFNSDGLAEEDPYDEPGAVYEQGDKDQYDIKKIYDFPGFNVAPPPGTRDEQGQYWMSQMQAIHSKQAMLLMLNGKMADDGYKRKKLKLSTSTSKDNSMAEPNEMEIEDAEEGEVPCLPVNELFVPPLPQESIIKPPQPPLQLSQTVSEDSDYHSQELQCVQSPKNNTSLPSRMDSPSLSELESMKKQLLVQLQESNSNADASSKNNSLNTKAKTDVLPPSNEGTPESNRIRPNGANTSCGSIKSIDFGTPVLQSTSPYSKLPTSEKFSKNICDLMHFENLPDSTGKYEQMTGVLQKVRTTLAKLHRE